MGATFHTEKPGDVPVWVNKHNCKACDKCVAACPAGVLAMVYDSSSVLGANISIDYPDSCIGCMECELVCPDFAIYVSDRKEYKFAKLSDDAKQRQEQVRANNYMSVKQGAN